VARAESMSRGEHRSPPPRDCLSVLASTGRGCVRAERCIAAARRGGGQPDVGWRCGGGVSAIVAGVRGRPLYAQSDRQGHCEFQSRCAKMSVAAPTSTARGSGLLRPIVTAPRGRVQGVVVSVFVVRVPACAMTSEVAQGKDFTNAVRKVRLPW